MAVWRTKLKLSYETWHLTHIVLAVVAVAAGILHMVGWSFYFGDPWKRALWIGLTIFWIGLLLYVRIVKPLFVLRRPYRISEVRKERGDTWTLVMQPDGHRGFRFRPGQFGWLTVWGSPFKITAHPFSFSSSAAVTDGRVEMSIRNLGDFTNEIRRGAGGTARLHRRPVRRVHHRPPGGHARAHRRWRRHHADDEHDQRRSPTRATSGR